jgi:hypothetical protein
MTCRQHDEQGRLACEKRIAANEKRLGSLLNKSGKDHVEFAFRASAQNEDSVTDGVGRPLYVPYLGLSLWISWIYQECDQRRSRHKFAQQLQSLCFEFHG